MDLFRANFGEGNCFWPEVKARGSLLLFEDAEVHACQQAGDLEGARAAMIDARRRFKGGDAPRENVLSRWSALHRELEETNGDVWLFWASDGLWWGESTATPIEVEEAIDHPLYTDRKIVRLWKPLKHGWQNTNKRGRSLGRAAVPPVVVDLVRRRNTWARMHREREFLIDLIEGADLADHYRRLAGTKSSASRGVWTSQPALPPPDWRSTAKMMVDHAKQAAARSGLATLTIAKAKSFGFLESDLYMEIARLLEDQGRCCAYTGIALKRVGEEPSDQCASLDRIDSGVGYEPENLQLVCRFINQMKSSTADGDFRRRLAWIHENGPSFAAAEDDLDA